MKKVSLIFALIFSSLLTVSCGSDDDDSGSRIEREEVDGKDLFSLWTNLDSDSSLILDFREYSFNRGGTFQYRVPEGLVCICSIEFDGSQRGGDIFLNDCSGFAICDELSGTYSYEKSQNRLRICDSRRDCDTFE